MTATPPSAWMARVRGVTSWPWYPGVALLGFAVYVFADYPLQAQSGLRAFLLALGAGVVATALWIPFLGRDRAGLGGSLVIALLIGLSGVLGMALTVAALILLWIERRWTLSGRIRRPIPWGAITRMLNILTIVFLVLQAGRGVSSRMAIEPLAVPADWVVAPGTPTPDVFVIVADGHGRSDVLAARYGYDDSDFQRELRALGFQLSPDSHANHAVTRFSMAVLLNGRPLSELGQDLSTEANGELAFAAVLKSSAISMLEQAGYTTTVISSGFEHVPLTNVDRYIDVGPRNEFEQALWGNTAIGAWVDSVTGAYVDGKRERVLRDLEALRAVAAVPSAEPAFVLTHLSAPHFPMVLNADCSLRAADQYTLGSMGRSQRAGDDTAVRVQADQTRCVDRLLEDTLAELVQVRPNAVIILMSDHGPEELLDWAAPDPEAVRGRMANLFWARTPGREGVFPADVSLVNVFPDFANAYLGTDLRTHPNDLFFGPAGDRGMFTPVEPDGTRR